MEVDTIKLDASGSKNAVQNSKTIAPLNTIGGKPIEEFTKVIGQRNNVLHALIEHFF